FEVLRSELCVGEETRRFDDRVNTELAPGEVRGLALGEHANLAVSDDEVPVFIPQALGRTAVHRVEVEEICERVTVTQAVHCDALEVAPPVADCAEDSTADTAKAIDCDTRGHFSIFLATIADCLHSLDPPPLPSSGNNARYRKYRAT